ncbi:MAG TPA: M3 family metallopeptidase [Anaeromyxobacteraceae bacterium]|nr:M3 family metallopeptidase [Anaeromyxobacteraceae bacterium]
MTLETLLASAAVLAAAVAGTEAPAPAGEQSAPATPARNPLLAPWTGPYGGVPPFDRAKAEHLKSALEAGIADQLADVDRIAAEPSPPTFANTLAALEGSGRTLERVKAVYGVFQSTLNGPEVQAVEREMEPKLAAMRDRVVQNEKLFARIASVYEGREAGLTPEQKRLAWLYYTDFARAGARLDAVSKARLAELNQRLATLSTTFSQNLLAEENDRMLLVEDQADLDGLPESVRSAAAAAAAARGHPGKWAILNTRSSVEPFLESSRRRDLREKVWRTFVNRGDNGDAHDNNAVIAEMVKLRAERARLLGHPTHAHWTIEDQMARTPERAMALMEAVWKPAVARVHEEVADMQALADKAGAGIRIEPWDYRFYAEQVRKAKYDLDENEVKPYLELDRLRQGMFHVARRVFGLTFTPVGKGEVPVQHPDVSVWRVSDARGRHVGLWYFDPFARPGKRSGAWMNEYRRQERFQREVPGIVSNNSNFVKGKPGQPVLVSWDDARTLFHEFGHALHGLSSSVTYPSLSGTQVARDYVEFPSQLLEHWLSTPEVLDRFARHWRTGKPMPRSLVAKIERASKFNEGFRTVEYLSSALVDMKLHLAGEGQVDPHAFERETLQALGMPREMVMRHRLPQFLHLFGGDGYSAGYYSYLWADTLTADAWEAFTGAGGPWDRAVAARLVKNVFSAGNTVDPAEAYRAFRGRDAGIDALMRKRGFAAPGAAGAGAPAAKER